MHRIQEWANFMYLFSGDWNFEVLHRWHWQPCDTLGTKTPKKYVKNQPHRSDLRREIIYYFILCRVCVCTQKLTARKHDVLSSSSSSSSLRKFSRQTIVRRNWSNCLRNLFLFFLFWTCRSFLMPLLLWPLFSGPCKRERVHAYFMHRLSLFILTFRSWRHYPRLPFFF